MEVLLVDDSRVMRQFVRRTLRQAGFDVKNIVEAENGQQAIEKLASYTPDLVLSDWNMPTMSGIDMLAALRDQGNQVPVGFVTSESTPSMKARAAGLGALFVLTKPFNADDMREVLSASGLVPSMEGGGGRRVDLTSRAFDGKLLSEMLTGLVSVDVSLKPGPKLVASVTPCVSVTWVDDADELVYAGFCELSIAASLGAALGLRPASSVADMLRTKTLPETMQADVREVFNVMSRTFNDCGSVHVRLGEITFPPTPSSTTVNRLDRKAAARHDFQVKIQGFGMGKLSLFSRYPQFLAIEGTKPV